MVAGELAAEGTPRGVKSQQRRPVFWSSLWISPKGFRSAPARSERWRVSLFGDRLHVITDDDLEAGHDATVAKLTAAGMKSIRREEQYSLETLSA